MTRTEKNYPVIVTGDNCLDYSVINNYMNMKQKVVKVDKKLAEQATGVRYKRRQGRGKEAVIGEEEGGANNGEDAFMGRENVQEQEYGNGDAAEGDVEMAVRWDAATLYTLVLAVLQLFCTVNVALKYQQS